MEQEVSLVDLDLVQDQEMEKEENPVDLDQDQEMEKEENPVDMKIGQDLLLALLVLIMD